METITQTDLLHQLRWRYATKSFDTTRPIPAETWDALLEALRLTPTSYGLQPYRFVVVESPELRAALRPHSWNQAQVTDASKFIVFLAHDSFTQKDVDHLISATSATRGVPPEALEGYRTMMGKHIVEGMDDSSRLIWSIKQTYIALGNLLTSAALLGIDACPIEGIDAAKYDELLGVEGFKTQMVVALGYRNPDDKYAQLAKVRYCREEIFEIR